ncbi:unnamed protein product [Ceratitis capitata]|uniref:(Mediterranean fruit fly) hypothetical protein n=1 Tax=Ceratitis capitata TaxID=7213 RepID=A0A811V554_CERCA|nr:unnamed protein product [Ceratitis capitata]
MREALRITTPATTTAVVRQQWEHRLRMHIINIHKNTKRNDAAAALAFGHFNGEKEVNEPYGSNGKHNLGHLPWNPGYISLMRRSSFVMPGDYWLPTTSHNADYAYNGC